MRLAITLVSFILVLSIMGCQSGINEEKAKKIVKDYMEEVKKGNLDPQKPEKAIEDVCKKNGTTLQEWNTYIAKNPNIQKELQKAVTDAMTGDAGKLTNPPTGQPNTSTPGTPTDLNTTRTPGTPGTSTPDAAKATEMGTKEVAGDSALLKNIELQKQIQEETQKLLTSLPQDKMMQISTKLVEIGQKMEGDEANATKYVGEMVKILKDAGLDVSKLEKLIATAK